MDIKRLAEYFSEYEEYEEVFQIQNCSNIYVKFKNPKIVDKIIKDHNQNKGLKLGKMKLCAVKKLPLDLNKASKIVLVTVYHEKIEVNAFTVFDVFKSFGQINKIIVFKKKNYQIFIEFESTQNAFNFKTMLHNKFF